MNYSNSEVHLSIQLMGSHSNHGSYTHFCKVSKTGEEINAIKVDKPPIFCKAYKTVHLSNEFVKGALAEPPESMKNMSIPVWKGISEKKRIALHVNAYVKALTPEHRGYTMEIM